MLLCGQNIGAFLHLRHLCLHSKWLIDWESNRLVSRSEQMFIAQYFAQKVSRCEYTLWRVYVRDHQAVYVGSVSIVGGLLGRGIKTMKWVFKQLVLPRYLPTYLHLLLISFQHASEGEEEVEVFLPTSEIYDFHQRSA